MPSNKPQDLDQANTILIGENFSILGDLFGPGAVIVSGRVEGNISAKKVISTLNSFINGNIQCAELDISGSVKGLVEAGDVIVRKTAIVDGEVRYGTLAMEQGAEILGKLKRSDKNQPDVKYMPDGKANQKNEMLFFEFPKEIKAELQKHPSTAEVVLTLADGLITPPWVSIQKGMGGVLINDSEQVHAVEWLTLNPQLTLSIGDQSFNFRLLPR
jgi:cytoskeletal protein CcmA (bactofilin family)